MTSCASAPKTRTPTWPSVCSKVLAMWQKAGGRSDFVGEHGQDHVEEHRPAVEDQPESPSEEEADRGGDHQGVNVDPLARWLCWSRSLLSTAAPARDANLTDEGRSFCDDVSYARADTLICGVPASARPIMSGGACPSVYRRQRARRSLASKIRRRLALGRAYRHLAFYRRGRYANPDNVDDWLTINGYCSEHLNIARHGEAGKGAPNCQLNLEAVICGYGNCRMASCNKLESPSRLRSMCLVRST